jgi:hypothetical protein
VGPRGVEIWSAEWNDEADRGAARTGAVELAPFHDAAHIRGLGCVRDVVGDHAHQPTAKGDRWGPTLVDNPVEVLVG